MLAQAQSSKAAALVRSPAYRRLRNRSAEHCSASPFVRSTAPRSTPGRLLSVLLLGWCFISGVRASATEAWIAALQQMPLPAGVRQLNETNCAPVLLQNFQSNAVAKAFVFLPGATDELYFFKRVQVSLTNANPTIWHAVVALTNQSPLRVTFQAPAVLLYSGEDVLELDRTIQHEATLRKLQTAKPLPHVLALDRDWTQLLGQVKKHIPATVLPFAGTKDSWHFYRHTFAGWNLTPWETLEVTARAGKTRFTVVRRGVIFSVDDRVGELPKLDRFPGR
jgi:hypothetical protein